ncbi:sulfurtransferase complex subunit TusB [Pantoea sp. 1.19]|uniref:sulfurtransferase complex subunit TusB n=1 Tax=Pantoea sp. 1.19 TaxID=1925589 RepID=UPI000948ED81|nr:sulfurtransferase complex subunit TusB [Pantoea sp. 1.19]
MLHTLSRSPTRCDFQLLLRSLRAGDELLLFQDGVLGALAQSRAWAQLSQTGVAVSVLADDVAARGLSEQIVSDIAAISYTEFVAMTTRHRQQMAW